MKRYQKVKTLLADPKRWIKGSYARDDKSRSVLVHSPRAICWCLSGAVCKIYRNPNDRAMVRNIIETSILKLVKLNKLHVPVSIVGFNDFPLTTHKDVMKVLKDANK